VIVRAFALLVGVVYAALGVLGFIPPLLLGGLSPALGPFDGFLFGVFAVNWIHNLVHLATGIAGILAFRSSGASLQFFRIIGFAYLVIFILGVMPGRVSSIAISWIRYVLPLNFGDNILHLATFVLAFVLYFAARRVTRRHRAGAAAGQPA
jgi:hypothetical protein